jgi:hypothetical protein
MVFVILGILAAAGTALYSFLAKDEDEGKKNKFLTDEEILNMTDEEIEEAIDAGLIEDDPVSEPVYTQVSKPVSDPVYTQVSKPVSDPVYTQVSKPVDTPVYMKNDETENQAQEDTTFQKYQDPSTPPRNYDDGQWAVDK